MTRALRSLSGLALGLLALSLVSDPALAKRKDPLAKLYSESLSEEAFERIRPTLESLEPDASLLEAVAGGLQWKVHTVKKSRREKVQVASADGWVEFLSGGVEGAVFGLGRFTGLLEESLFGEHVFGYLWGNATLVPRLLLRTRATRVSEEEYEAITDTRMGARGKLVRRDRVYYFADVRVVEVRDTGIARPRLEGARMEPIEGRGLADVMRAHASEESFQRAVPRLRALSPGAEVIDIVRELGGFYLTTNGGRDFWLFMDGYLAPFVGAGHDLERFTRVNTETAAIEIWPFGEIDAADNPIPRMALAFENQKLVAVLEDPLEETLSAFLEPYLGASAARVKLAPAEGAKVAAGDKPCRSTPAPGKKKVPLLDPDPACGSIAVEVHVRQGMLKKRVAIQRVFFVRVEAGSDPLSATAVVPSSYARQGRLYLLNAPPGRYAAVASYHSGALGLKGHFAFYHSPELIERTVVDVEPGRLVFLGHYLLNHFFGMEKADPVQAHYYQLLQPEAASAGDWKRAIHEIYPNLGSLHLLEDDVAAEADFWRRAKSQEFARKGAWLKLIDQHLEAAPGP